MFVCLVYCGSLVWLVQLYDLAFSVIFVFG